MPTLLLVQPRFTSRALDRNVGTLYPLGLACVAAAVPRHWRVEAVDEQVERLDPARPADLVGITTTTLTANRAYAVAAAFRARGIPVVLGGVHASMCPDEALAHADAACIGDGEPVMGRIIEDFEAGRLGGTYTAPPAPLETLPHPRRDLFRHRYAFLPVSTSRGCPNDCAFCAIHRFYGGTYRLRSVDDVLAELRALPATHGTVFLTDGNAYGHTPAHVTRYKDLCRGMAAERGRGTLPFRHFMAYVPVTALDDEEALDLTARAGGRALFVGFESVEPAALAEVGKGGNLRLGVEAYPRLLENARRRGILVVGEMVVGTDAEDEGVLARTAAFLEESPFDLLRLQILQPLPGTRLFDRLQREDRLLLREFPRDWQRLADGFTMGVHFRPRHLEARRLQQWVKEAGLRFYAPHRVGARALRAWRATGDARLAATLAVMSWKSRKTYANAPIPPEPAT